MLKKTIQSTLNMFGYEIGRKVKTNVAMPVELNDAEHEIVRHIKEIQPSEGMLVLFLSTPLSIHGVSLLEGDSTQRFFSYGSYSLNKDVKWKIIN
jgi:hypothetical protein